MASDNTPSSDSEVERLRHQLAHATAFEVDGCAVTAITAANCDSKAPTTPTIIGWEVVNLDLGLYLAKDGEWIGGATVFEDDDDAPALKAEQDEHAARCQFASLNEAWAALERDRKSGQ